MGQWDGKEGCASVRESMWGAARQSHAAAPPWGTICPVQRKGFPPIGNNLNFPDFLIFCEFRIIKALLYVLKDHNKVMIIITPVNLYTTLMMSICPTQNLLA